MEYTRTLRYQYPLIRGEDVLAVQKALIALKVRPPYSGADGVFGAITASSVKGFQHSYNVAGSDPGTSLAESGEVDDSTWGALFGRASDANATASHIQTAAAALKARLPGSTVEVVPCLNATQVRRVRDWMAGNFEATISNAIAGTPIDTALVYAIACQETASVWLGWLETMPTEDILARCVFDASGDSAGSSRSAFPANTAEFRQKMGDQLTDMLITEANATRALRKLPPAQWVYKGYGIFQYDLQNILSDLQFFGQRQWGDFGTCIDRFMREMRAKLAAASDLTDAVRRYNGTGPRAERYAAAVMTMRAWCRERRPGSRD